MNLTISFGNQSKTSVLAYMITFIAFFGSVEPLFAASSETEVAQPVPIKVKGFDKANTLNNIDFGRYKTVFLLEPEIEFNSHWYRENRRKMSQRDEQRIRETYTRILKEQLEKKLLEMTDLAMVDEVQGDTLVIRASLEEFRITAPDVSLKPRTKDYVDHIGAARVIFQLIDGASNQELSALSDYKETSPAIGINELKQTNRVRNVRDFQLLFGRWAKRLGQFIQP